MSMDFYFNFFFLENSKFFLYFFFFSKIVNVFNMFFLILSMIFFSMIYYFSSSFNFFFFEKNFYLKKKINYFLMSSLMISFFMFFLSFLSYMFSTYLYYNNVLNDLFFFTPKFLNFFSLNFFFFNWFNFFFSLDLFGFSLIFLAYVTGFFSLLVLDTRIYWKNLKFLFSFNMFVVIVYFYSSVSNLLLFFFFYEALLMPSFLFVYYMSPSKSAMQASMYFVMWTQVGSILVLLVFSYFSLILQADNFFLLKNISMTSMESFFMYMFLFLGFGFKVPVWPFHYWLTKTHVEAPSGFSIYLSGFLVKSALFGFYKMTSNVIFNVDSSFFVLICFFSVFDSSLKMWGQTDLKKLAAYGTIQEMNLMYMSLVLGDNFSMFCSMLFVMTHAFLSAFMFFLVDCVYKSFHTSSMVLMNGMLNMCPNLGMSIVLMLIFFSGLPGTVKFTVEFILFNGILEYSIFFCFFLIVTANIFGLIGFSKNWLNSLFGLKVKKLKYSVLDLTFKELFLTFLLCFFLFFFSFFFNYFIF